MPCLGNRKKPNGRQQGITYPCQPESISSHQSSTVAQIMQEYTELKSKNQEHFDIIAKQTTELEFLRKQLQKSESLNQMSISECQTNDKDDTRAALQDLEIRNKKALFALAEKEIQLEESNKKVQELSNRLNHQDADSALHSNENEKQVLQEPETNKGDGQIQQNEADTEKLDMYKQLEEKDNLLREKEMQLEKIRVQWEAERAELAEPALKQVNTQLEELKETNKIAVQRLTEKENELADLRSQLIRRDRKPKQSLTKDQENQKRLNRLTIDLENDRLLIQRLDELNQQLETQKKKHESILESQAKTIAEKDQALLLHQKSLKHLKITQEYATKQLEQEQLHNLEKFQLQHQNEVATLNKRLKHAENQAKSNANDELDQILVEFEQSQHNHSVQVAHLQKSYQEQVSAIRHGQEAETQNFTGSEKCNNTSKNMFKQSAPNNGSVPKLRNHNKFNWPPVAV